MQKREIIKNVIETPDGTWLESKNPILCNVHLDKNGKKYIVSGGGRQLERYGATDYIERTIYADTDIEIVREIMTWGSFGVTDLDSLTIHKLKDLTEEHIDNILLTQKHISEGLRSIFIKELNYRISDILSSIN